MAAALDEMPLCEPVVHFLPIAEAKTPIPPAVTAKRTVVPKRFFSPPLDSKFKPLQRLPAAKPLPGLKRLLEPAPTQEPVDEAEAGAKRARQLESGDEAEAVAEQNVGEGAAPAPAAAGAAPAQPAGGEADVSGLDLLCFATEATPYKLGSSVPAPAAGLGPLVSPLGALAHLVATSPFAFVPGHRPPRAPPGAGRKLARLPASGSGCLAAAAAAAASAPAQAAAPALQAATALVTRLAPAAAAAAAAHWLDVLASDLRARHAALRKSRGRLARSLGALAEGRSTADGAAAALLLRQLDGALAGEEGALGARLRELQGVRLLCGAPEGEALRTGPITTWGALPEEKLKAPKLPRVPLTEGQAAAASAALILTAAYAADAHKEDD